MRVLRALRAAFWLPLLSGLLSGCASVAQMPAGTHLEVEQVALLPEEISETSGIAWQDASLWTHNDSGDGPVLYRLSARTGAVERRVRLQDSINLDWEELAASEQGVYVLDCGNNLGQREWMQAYHVSWQALKGASARSELLEFRFADAKPAHAAYAHDNDCEAATVVGRDLWVFTKNWSNQKTRLYRLDTGKAGQQSLQPVATFPVAGLVTAADYDPESSRLALLGYTKSRLLPKPFLWLVPVVEDKPVWSEAQYHSLSPAGQWEAIGWHQGDLWLTRESSLLGQAWLGRIRMNNHH